TAGSSLRRGGDMGLCFGNAFGKAPNLSVKAPAFTGKPANSAASALLIPNLILQNGPNRAGPPNRELQQMRIERGATRRFGEQENASELFSANSRARNENLCYPFTSHASRNPSPTKFSASSVETRKPPGKAISHQ